MTQQWYRTETVINKGTTKEVHLPPSPQKKNHNESYGFLFYGKNKVYFSFWSKTKNKASVALFVFSTHRFQHQTTILLKTIDNAK